MVIGAFLFPKVFTGVADAAASGAACGFAAALGFAVAVATGAAVPCARRVGAQSAAVPRISTASGILKEPPRSERDNGREFNLASRTFYPRKRLNIVPRLLPRDSAWVTASFFH